MHSCVLLQRSHPPHAGLVYIANDVMTVDVASLGLFILDTFEWRRSDSDGESSVIRRDEGVIGGGGTYAMIGSRIWLPADRVGILVDRGYDWPKPIEEELNAYGEAMWVYRDQPEHPTTRALNLYTGERRGACRTSCCRYSTS